MELVKVMGKMDRRTDRRMDGIAKSGTLQGRCKIQADERVDEGAFFVVLGILLMARSGLKTRTVRIADRLRFSVMTQYSSALHTHTRTTHSGAC